MLWPSPGWEVLCPTWRTWGPCSGAPGVAAGAVCVAVLGIIGIGYGSALHGTGLDARFGQKFIMLHHHRYPELRPQAWSVHAQRLAPAADLHALGERDFRGQHESEFHAANGC